MLAEPKELSKSEYDLFRELVYKHSGINLGEHKMQLVRARLGKRVREGQFGSFREYYEFVEKDSSGEELCKLLDAISTNTTHLFREIRHFVFLTELLNRWAEDASWRNRCNCLRIWSAACSSGEEPHSLAMVVYGLLQRFKGLEAKILATDLSTRMLSKAMLGQYELHRVGTIPPEYRNKCLRKASVEGNQVYQVIPEVRRLITFSRFNLMTPTFPFKHGFHVIFCRNVMIYFDKQTQEALVNKMASHLKSGGHLMIGHSESLNSIQHPLNYVEPTVYRRA